MKHMSHAIYLAKVHREYLRYIEYTLLNGISFKDQKKLLKVVYISAIAHTHTHTERERVSGMNCEKGLEFRIFLGYGGIHSLANIRQSRPPDPGARVLFISRGRMDYGPAIPPFAP